MVAECEGEYHHDSRKNQLLWQVPVMDASNKSGSMEFSIAGHPDDFFPVNVSFFSKKLFCDLAVSVHINLEHYENKKTCIKNCSHINDGSILRGRGLCYGGQLACCL